MDDRFRALLVTKDGNRQNVAVTELTDADLMEGDVASKESRSLSKKTLDEIAKKIARIVNAIAEGTDTPALRQTLLTLECERVELESTFAGVSPSPPISAEPPTPPVLAALFRRKVERLEETLNADPGITSAAAPILRNLIDAIILHPRERKGRMLIEVYGEPSVLFLPADNEPADEKNMDDNGGSGGENPP